jgi:hypothetical protein
MNDPVSDAFLDPAEKLLEFTQKDTAQLRTMQLAVETLLYRLRMASMLKRDEDLKAVEGQPPEIVAMFNHSAQTLYPEASLKEVACRLINRI